MNYEIVFDCILSACNQRDDLLVPAWFYQACADNGPPHDLLQEYLPCLGCTVLKPADIRFLVILPPSVVPN